MANDDKFLEEIIVTMREIQEVQIMANTKHGHDEIDRHYIEKWDKLIKDTENRRK